jgi:hypothetical protein
MTRAGRILLVAAALAMLAYRFVHVDLAPFARDEPQFLAAAREQLRTGHWLSANPLYGNLGLRYGATAFWFYGVVQALFGDDPRVAIVAMGLTVTLAHLAFALMLTRLFDESAVFFAALVAWIASSPYQFLWSRLAWDLTSNAAVFAAAALLCSYGHLRPARAAALGLALGLGISTHPMLAPLAIAVVIAVAWEMRGRVREAVASAAALMAGMIVMNVPYLLFLLEAPVVGRAPRQPLSLDNLGSLVLQSPRIATIWGLPYYFGGAWSDFRLWLAWAAEGVDMLAVVALVVSVAAAAAGVALALAAPDPRHRRLGLAALVAWLGNIVLLAVVRLEGHPHYHFASMWVPVLGMAAALAWLRGNRPRAGAAVLGLVALIAVAQFAVIVQWMGFIRATGGTRTPSYGTPIGLQIEAMQAACATAEPLVVIRNETEMFPFPFAYIATTEPACRDRKVVVCADTARPFTKPCPPAAAGEHRVRLRYAGETGGTLAVE